MTKSNRTTNQTSCLVLSVNKSFVNVKSFLIVFWLYSQHTISFIQRMSGFSPLARCFILFFTSLCGIQSEKERYVQPHDMRFSKFKNPICLFVNVKLVTDIYEIHQNPIRGSNVQIKGRSANKTTICEGAKTVNPSFQNLPQNEYFI